MRSLQFRSRSGRKYRVNLPDPLPGLKSAYLFSYHKSGSTLLDNMIRAYCQQMEVPVFALFNAAFDAGIPTSEIGADTQVCFAAEGRIYTGFRHFPSFDLQIGDAHTVMLVRDPRDMLVSMYYSMVNSHVAPKKHKKFLASRNRAARMNIDQFVLKNVQGYLHNFRRYQQMLPVGNQLLYRYEDVIYQKRHWLSDLVTQLGLPMDSALVQELAQRFDIIPDQENPDAHIRQVHPGNYRSKLQTATIDTLSHELQDFLVRYGYE